MVPAIRLENNGVPIYVQIRDQMLRAIGTRVLRPGERMPTMRQVAVALKVDLNTVRHAYDELAQTGAIVVLRARGTFVAEKSSPTELADRARELDRFAEQVITRAAAAGLDPGDVARRIAQAAKKKDTKS